jgi:hypothetical protein
MYVEPTVEPERIGEVEPPAAWPTIGLVGGLAVSAVSVALAAVAGPPYLSLSSLNPWIAVFAVAAFVALFAVPFAANRRIVAGGPERAEAWEAAMLVWGGAALAALGLGLVLAAAGGFSPARSLADAVGLLLLVEAGVVLLVLLAWILSS